MTELIFFGTLLLALATLYARLKNGSAVLFDKVCNAYLLFVIIHTVFLFIVYIVSGFHTWYLAVPFIVAYSPFFYIGMKSLGKGLSKRDILVHCAPFFIFIVLYIVIISDSTFTIHYLKPFCIIQYLFAVMSFFVYTGRVLFYKDFKDSANEQQRMQLVKTGSYSVAVIVLFFLVAVLSGYLSVNDLRPEVLAVIAYSGIFISVALAFVFTVSGLLNAKQHTARDTNKKEKEREAVSVEEENREHNKSKELKQKYNKSALSPAVLDDYKEKLDLLINEENVYLDNELTLEILAKKMRIPMHHLTQLFNIYLGENFNQYINRYRVEKACEMLLENDDSLSIEQVAFNSGFNSKVSFNRHFKNITGYSPKEYIYNRKSTDD
jgi:AraC-like DNA-binding protein